MTSVLVTATLPVPGAVLAYDVRGPLPTRDGKPPLLMIGQPMEAAGFTTLAGLFPDRTVLTYDPRGLGRSARTDGRTDHDPRQQADDLHHLVGALGAGPVDLFASSGGAVTALAWVEAHPADVRTLVAHEPPLLGILPDATQAFAAEAAFQQAYQEGGFGAGMAAFMAVASWQGPYPDSFELPDPAQSGFPLEDDGSRDDPMMSGAGRAVTAFLPDPEALRAASTRVLIAAGTESRGTSTWRASEALAELLDQPLTLFPSHHGGFMGGEHGYAGEPEAFAARLREVLGG